MRTSLHIATFCLLFSSHFLSAQTTQKARLIVLTDIENEPDDSQSMVRLLLYSNVIDLEGIVATTSVWKKKNVAPEAIEKIIQAYGKIQPNLIKHEPGFPDGKSLLTKLKKGSGEYGMAGVGEGKDSEGSDWIISALEKNDPRPLWISVWGGVNTLAQALYKIEKSKSKEEAAKLIARLRVYTISDQDDSGIWIRNKYPALFYIVSPGDAYRTATWIAINTVVEGINNETISNTWIEKNIQRGHGPLGAAYPDVAYGMEGDTPSWLSLIPNGLNKPESPDWGGWGGRYELYKPDFATTRKGSVGSGVPNEAETREIWTNASDRYSPHVHSEYGRAVRMDTSTFTGNKVSLWRWRNDFQNDFAARMDWCTKPYNEANHPPVPVLGTPEEITVRSGEKFTLDAIASSDPDGDNLSFLWFHYPEPGSYDRIIGIFSAENIHVATIVAPKVDKKETAHFILRVTDKGEPPLSRYKRVVVNIVPE